MQPSADGLDLAVRQRGERPQRPAMREVRIDRDAGEHPRPMPFGGRREEVTGRRVQLVVVIDEQWATRDEAVQHMPQRGHIRHVGRAGFR